MQFFKISLKNNVLKYLFKFLSEPLDDETETNTGTVKKGGQLGTDISSITSKAKTHRYYLD